jgi:hypothetical protein
MTLLFIQQCTGTQKSITLIYRFPSKMNRFRSYLKSLFPENDSILKEWDFERIQREVDMWSIRNRWLKIYVLTNDSDSSATHTMVGCVDNLLRRIDQQNGSIPGGRPEAKRAEGHWKPICYVFVPPYRNYSTKVIKKESKNGRGWESRSIIALKNAIARGLQFKVFVDTLKPSSRFYAKRIAELISDYMKSNNLTSLEGYLFAHGNGAIEKEVVDSVSAHILSLNSTTAATSPSNGNSSPHDTKKRKRSNSDKPSKPKTPPPPLIIGPDGIPIKRKRGRPRKYPLPTAGVTQLATANITKVECSVSEATQTS